eukprot:snap_masked-scaffold_17-processed-gene-2.29-mRNA-1 protein AED:1.00 eAED:1.00 QI:0/-1/0/0/-1/1/1/0/447
MKLNIGISLLYISIQSSVASVTDLLNAFDTDLSGGLNESEIDSFLQHIRGQSSASCISAEDVLQAVNSSGQEATSIAELTEVLTSSVSCLLHVNCAAEMTVGIDGEVYACEEHNHEEEEHENEGEVSVTVGIHSLECSHDEHDDEEGNEDFTSAIWSRSLFATLGTCLLSLVGIFLIIFGIDPKNMPENSPILFDMLAFALGVLLWATLVHIVPEGVEGVGGDEGFGNFVMLGVLIGLITELSWPAIFSRFGKKTESGSTVENGDKDPELKTESEKREIKDAPIIANILFGDFLHNYVDGVIIALAFGVCNSVSLGASVTVGIVAHEIPQELSDFTVLVKCGLNYKEALLFNLLSSGSALLGAFTILANGDMEEVTQGRLLLVSGGILLFIVMSELYPMISGSIDSRINLFRRLFFIGVGVTLGVLINHFVPHEHCHVGHDHEGHDH